jgi:hypothetical protein
MACFAKPFMMQMLRLGRWCLTKLHFGQELKINMDRFGLLILMAQEAHC